MRHPAPTFLLASVFFVAGGAMARSTADAGPASATPSASTSAIAGSGKATATTRADAERFIDRFEPATRSCVQRCILDADVVATGDLGSDWSSWTFDQFSGLWPEPTRLCLGKCPGVVVGATNTTIVPGTTLADSSATTGTDSGASAPADASTAPATPDAAAPSMPPADSSGEESDKGASKA